MPTPIEPDEHGKPDELHSDTCDDIPNSPQPHDALPEHMSASEHPVPDYPHEALDEATTDEIDREQQMPVWTPLTEAPSGKPRTSLHRTRLDRATGAVHLLFGAVEDLLADLTVHGAPDGGVVRVERLVRNRADTMGGVATLGIAVTARRADEILSCWVIVARLGLDPWGRPVSREVAQRATRRHHDAQRLISALVADAGFDVRLGLYHLREDCYTLAATCEVLRDLHDHPARSQGNEAHGEEQAPTDKDNGTGDQADHKEREESMDEEETEERGGEHDA